MPQRRGRVRFLRIGVRWTDQGYGRYVEANDQEGHKDVLYLHLELGYPTAL
jgi:hypothetical protein